MHPIEAVAGGLPDLAGVVGVALIVGTYLGLQTGRIETRDPRYSLLNGIGAALIIVSLCFDFNLSAFLVEAFWLVISVYGLAKRRG